MKLKIAALAFSLLASSVSYAGGSASSVLLKVYGVWASTDPYCTNPVKLFDDEDGQYTDFLNKPNLGGGDLADGTYHCVIIRMGDTVKFVPTTNQGAACVAGTEYKMDVCRTGTSTTTAAGGTESCTGNDGYAEGVDKTYLHLSTASSGAFGEVDVWNRPSAATVATTGLRLASPFIAAGGGAGTLVVNTDDRVQTENSGANCGMMPPAFSFR